MATVSAVSAFANAAQQNPDKYDLRAYVAETVHSATSAYAVLGTIYDCSSGYNYGLFKLNDWDPSKSQIDSNAFIKTQPSYRASTFTYDASKAAGYSYGYAKLFTSNIDTKYVYTGSTEESEYGSFGPVITRYARHMHISGNVAYNTRMSYEQSQIVERLLPLMRLNVRYWCPTMFDHLFYEAEFTHYHTAWLDAYVESAIPEEIARHIVLNPAFVGTRLNSANELHLTVPVTIHKAANSWYLDFTRTDAETTEVEHRIGRFLFDFELTI